MCQLSADEPRVFRRLLEVQPSEPTEGRVRVGIRRSAVRWVRSLRLENGPVVKRRFFNRTHATEGAYVLTALFSFFGVTFSVLDLIQFTALRKVAAAFVAAAIGCGIASVIIGRSQSATWRAVSVGAFLAMLFLGTSWILAKTGG